MKIYRFLLGIYLILASSCNDIDEPEKFVVRKYDPVNVIKSNSMQVYVHYMPWFETPQSSGKWGAHWTMSTKNPEITDNNGKREIASHYYPLIGPYASGDADLIEYHLLLMKYSGIDGVLFDWYGSSDINDYASIRENTEAFTGISGSVGLKFGIVYEDRTITAALQQDNSKNRIDLAKTDMEYIQENYFSEMDYIQIQRKPLLLVFGPEEFHKPEEWSEVMSVFDEVCFLILNGKSQETAPYSTGEYIWVDNSSLENKYNTKNNFEIFFGGAYPGFDDFYYEGGWGYGFDWKIFHDNGNTFKVNLDKAKNSGVDYVQLITWNDFGEGTMIEPTQEFGFTMLKNLQSFTGVTFTEDIFDNILLQYTLRKKFAANSDVQMKLDQSFYYFVSLQTDKAKEIIENVSQGK